jgi:hypothetical protein
MAMTLAASGVMILALWNLFFGYSALGQSRRRRLAAQHQPQVERIITSGPRFGHVAVGSTSAEGGCLLLIGRLATQKDLEDLRRAVSSAEPSVTVLFRLDDDNR